MHSPSKFHDRNDDRSLSCRICHRAPRTPGRRCRPSRSDHRRASLHSSSASSFTEVDAKLAHLHDVLFDVVGFVGNVDDYYNPANSYLPEVLRTHRGLPITLVLIYKCVAERIGLVVRGINSPGHFLAAVRSGEPHGTTGDTVRLDVRRSVLRRPGALSRRRLPPNRRHDRAETLMTHRMWLEPASHRQWLSRMLNNLQATFAQTGRERDLYAMLELNELLTN